jgi:hypothetical protein
MTDPLSFFNSNENDIVELCIELDSIIVILSIITLCHYARVAKTSYSWARKRKEIIVCNNP